MIKQNKKGSIITESAITLPIFIIAIVVMNSIILMYACIESCSFIASNEFRKGAAEAIYSDSAALIPYRIKNTAEKSYSAINNSRLIDYEYRTNRWGQDELIVMTLGLNLKSPNSIGLKSSARYNLSLVTRAYVGKIRDVEPMSESEMSGNDTTSVFIFPARGERYHGAGCQVLTAAFTSGSLNSSIKSSYRSCPLCKSGKVSDGTKIFYFPAAGEAYHTSNCISLKRRYIEIEKRDAIDRGYTPCMKCGGN